MVNQRKRVLIGDPLENRVKIIKEVLESNFHVDVTFKRTFDEVKKEHTSIDDWDLILISDMLPLSYSQPKVLLTHYLYYLSSPFLRTYKIGYITDSSEQISLPEILENQIEIIYIRTSEISALVLENIFSQISKLIPPKPLFPAMSLDSNDVILDQQIRNLDSNSNSANGQVILAKLVRDFFICDRVKVAKLNQGLSGAKVFRVSPFRESKSLGEFILKLYTSDSYWKIISEIKGQKKALKSFSTHSYKKHIPNVKKPLFPSESEAFDSSYIASTIGWYAICYDFLGGDDFGQFIDLETVLLSNPENLMRQYGRTRFFRKCGKEIRLFTLKEILEWLCKSWYCNNKLIKREIRLLWTCQSAPDRKYISFPPYSLTTKTKGYIFNFIYSRSVVIGERIIGKKWTKYLKNLKSFLKTSENKTGIPSLDQEIEVVLSPVHGDLNANNIFLWLDEPEHPFLIDFPFFQQSGHAVQDFARLEVEIVFSIMDRQQDQRDKSPLAFDHTFSQLKRWIELIDEITKTEIPTDQIEWSFKRNVSNLNLTFELVKTIRKQSLQVRNQISKSTNPILPQEYFAALLYHTIRAIGYDSLSLFKRLLAVYASGRIIEKLENC